MHEYIDKLLIDGKTDEAIPLIEEVWEKETQARKELIADITRKLDAFEKHKEAMRRPSDNL